MKTQLDTVADVTVELERHKRHTYFLEQTERLWECEEDDTYLMPVSDKQRGIKANCPKVQLLFCIYIHFILEKNRLDKV